MKRLLTRTGLKNILEVEPIHVDKEDTYQVYALIWDLFKCEQCGREECYRNPEEKFFKEKWIPVAAEKAKADGWFVPPWNDQGGLDCTAYCPKCKPRSE